MPESNHTPAPIGADAWTDDDLTRLYKLANGEDVGKAQPLTTQRIFRAMRVAAALASAAQPNLACPSVRARLATQWGYVPARAAQPEPHPPHRDCGCAECAPSFEADEPTLTVTMRYDLSPAAIEGAIRDKLIEMGWTPPDAAAPKAAPAEQYDTATGTFAGETLPQAAEHWAQWCERRCIGGLPEFLRFVGRIVAGAAQHHGAAYAELPEPNHGYHAMTGYTADQMRAFADATHALRASRGQAPAPAGLKDHEVATLVNRLRDVAIQYHDTQQLRERIAQEIRPVAAGLAAPAPAAPAGATDPWREHLADQADMIDCAALQRAMVKHGISFPDGGMEHFRAALGEMVNRFVLHATPTTQAAPAAVAGPSDEEIDAHVDLYRWDTTEGRRALVRATLARWRRVPAAQGDAPAPASLKDHEVAALVNRLRDVALQYHDTQQLRERIAQEIRPVAAGLAAPAPAAQGDALEWASEFEAWWTRNRVATHQVKSVRGLARQAYRAGFAARAAKEGGAP